MSIAVPLLRTTLILILTLWPTAEALAHRVNLFAHSDGTNIHVQAGFSRTQPARKATITVSLPGQNQVLRTLTTDAQGQCAFPIPPEAVTYGLVIRVNAGEGHVNTWTMSKEEFGAQPKAQPATMDETSPTTQTQKTDTPDWQAVLRSELSSQLAPLRRELAEFQTQLRLTDILGGIGWLVGLAGLFAAIRSKRSAKGS